MKQKKIVLLLACACTLSICACGGSDNIDNTVQREVKQVTDEKRYAEFITEDVEVEKDIIFASAENYKGQMQELGLDIYIPAGDEETARPAIIWAHGGGYTTGDKASEGLLKYLAVDFAKMGYVSVVPNYRLCEKVELADIDRAVEDGKAALEWVIDNAQAYGIDEKSIALVGYSAGGGIVKNLCYTTLYEDMDRSSILGVISISGDDLYHPITKSAAPACLAVHGTADTKVDIKVSEKFVKKMMKKGITSELYELEGLNHNVLTRYDEIRNQIGGFLYKQLTGQERELTLVSEVNIEYRAAMEREKNGIEYHTQQVDCKVDGKLDEWENVETIPMNQLKDAGEVIPTVDDYSGKAMVGWNSATPNVVYIAAEVTDDIYQNNIPADGKWYHDDCLEIIFDFSADGVAEQFAKYVVGASEDLSVLATKESVEAAVVKEGNTYYYEVAIDLGIMPEGTFQRVGAEQLFSGHRVGFSIAYNDSDNGERETQNGWTSGTSGDRSCFGNLIMK